MCQCASKNNQSSGLSKCQQPYTLQLISPSVSITSTSWRVRKNVRIDDCGKTHHRFLGQPVIPTVSKPSIEVWPIFRAHCRRSEEHTSELQSRLHLLYRLLL